MHSGYQKNKQGIAVGFDEGAVVVTMGREEPVRIPCIEIGILVN